MNDIPKFMGLAIIIALTSPVKRISNRYILIILVMIFVFKRFDYNQKLDNVKHETIFELLNLGHYIQCASCR